MNPPRHLIFVNRFYWPEEPATAQLLTDLAEALAALGHRVTIITSRPNASTASTESRNGVAIHRVGPSRLKGKNLWKRAIDFARFILAARRAVKALARPGDILVALSDPPLLGIALAPLALRQQLQLIHWIQDIFPEVAMEVGPWRLLSLLRPWRDRAWAQAAICVTLGQDMANLLRERAIPAHRIVLCPNWAPAGLTAQPHESNSPLRSSWGVQDKLNVVYSGNLGRVHDLEPIIATADLLRSERDITFIFIGDGAQRKVIEQQVAQRGLDNVLFFPAQPRPRLGETLAVGDLHLVTLRPGCERLVFPSKIYGIAAIGRPLLFIGPRTCELADLIRTHDMGLAFSRDQVPALAQAIRTLRDSPKRRLELSRSALAFSERYGALPHAATLWHDLIARLPIAGPLRENHNSTP